jgi:hypothetical protein
MVMLMFSKEHKKEEFEEKYRYIYLIDLDGDVDVLEGLLEVALLH